MPLFVPPPLDKKTNRFYLLFGMPEGEALQPIWFESSNEVEAVFGPVSYPVHTVGKFRYHWCLSSPSRGIRQRLTIFRFYLGKGLELRRERPVNCIVAYSHMITGLLGGALKPLTGAGLIIEIRASGRSALVSERRRRSDGCSPMRRSEVFPVRHCVLI